MDMLNTVGSKFSKLASIGKAAGAPALVGAGALGVGGFVGVNSYNKSTEEDSSDRLASAAGVGTSTAIYGAGAAGGAALIVGAPIAHAAKNVNVASILNKPVAMPNITAAGAKKFATSALGMGGAGALIGGAVGSQFNEENPNTGAAIGAAGGAVTGVVASTAMKGMNLWKNIGSVGRGGAIIGGALAIVAGSKALSPAQYQSESVSESDDAGSYSNTASSGVKSRLNKMNASGDMVFGLNSRR